MPFEDGLFPCCRGADSGIVRSLQASRPDGAQALLNGHYGAVGREGMIRRGAQPALADGESFLAGCRVEPHMLGRRAVVALATQTGLPSLPNAGLAARVPVDAKLGLVATDRRVLVFSRGPLGGFRLFSEYTAAELKGASFTKERLGRGTLMLELIDDSTALTTATEVDDAERFAAAVHRLSVK
jgi:hypothetical protein